MSEAIDPKHFRSVMGQVPTCVTVVTAIVDDAPVAMVIGSFVSISLDPPLAGFFCTTTSYTWQQLRTADALGVNVLSAEQVEVSNACMRELADRFDGLEWTVVDGAPKFAGTSAWIALSLREVIPAGDHELALCAVRRLEAPEPAASPLIFQGGTYRQLSSDQT